MFKFDPEARRAARTGFGAMLVVGAAVLWYGLATRTAPNAPAVIQWTWIAALVMYPLAGALAGRGAPRPLARASLILPSVGIALLLPLTVHLVVHAAVREPGQDFDSWAKLSALFTGPTHAVTAFLAAGRALQLADGKHPMRLSTIYGICVVVSAIPFAVFVLPPLIVAVTGVPVLVALREIERIAHRERAQPEPVPRAQVMHLGRTA